jgi:hypothetical protein
VLKIDTETLIEVARYRTGQPGADPSRTSVNLKGDVAITNRDGSITKIGAIEDQCKEKNGQPGIQTSTGPNDVLAWGADECVLWNTALMPASRPAAWTSGDLIDPDNPCSGFTGEKVWTSAPTRATTPSSTSSTERPAPSSIRSWSPGPTAASASTAAPSIRTTTSGASPTPPARSSTSITTP